MSEEPSASALSETLRLHPGADYVPAPLSARALAYLLDLVASVVITFSLNRAALLLLAGPMADGSFLARTFGLSTWFIGGLGYWLVVPMAIGSTPGKMLFHMRVVPERDRPLGPEQVILREIVGHALSIASLGIGFLIAARDDGARALHDRLAGTRLVQFTRPRPELYQVTDLRRADEAGTLHTDLLPAREEHPDEGGRSAGAPPGPEVRDVDENPTRAGPEEAPSTPAGPSESAPSPSAAREMPSIGGEGTGARGPSRTLYRRPEGETAYERKQRAAKGPTLPVLAEALRNTAALVDAGQLMPKVLERKRAEFVEDVRTADLGTDPRAAVQTVVELGREGLLTREELTRLRDILRERFKRAES